MSGSRKRKTSDADADGEVVWSWHPLLVSSSRRHIRPDRVWTSLQSADDGGKRNSSPGRARRKPLKPLRREGRMIPPTPVVSTPVLFVAQGAAGAVGTRPSLRPLFFGGRVHAQLGRIAPRERGHMLSIEARSLGAANGSRGCAPDDRLRDEAMYCFLVLFSRIVFLACDDDWRARMGGRPQIPSAFR